jgi:hypothetical protein
VRRDAIERARRARAHASVHARADARDATRDARCARRSTRDRRATVDAATIDRG